MRRLITPALSAAALALAGCTVGPDFQRPAAEVPAHWSAPASEAPVVDGPWWAGFNDPELTSLIDRSAAANLSLRQAALRIAEARAQRDVAAAARLPNLSANASFTSQRLSENTPTGRIFTSGGIPGLPPGVGLNIPNPYGQYQLGFDASWEVDLFGRVRRSVEASDADAAAALEDSRDALVSLNGEVARSYIDLRGAQRKQAVAEAEIGALLDLLGLTRQRRGAGLTSDIDVTRATAQLTGAQAQLPLLDRQIAVDINQLSRLMDLQPGALAAELAAAGPAPPAPPEVPLGLPADLARRRPDIRAAEARLHAATARIGVAKADLFPRLTLNATGGLQAEDISALTNWASRFSNLGPRVDLPVFDAGRRRATVRVQDARAREAALAYADAVLGALHEVENTLVAYRTEQLRRDSLAATVAQNRDGLVLARQRYDAGLASFLDVLDAERTLQQNQLTLADSDAAVSTDLVAIYKALGGGWTGTAAS